MLALTVLVGGLSLFPAAASAHGDEGELTVTSFEQVSSTAVRLEVGIVYAGDGHLAEDASVTATFAGPSGARVGPVELVRTGDTTSLYAATVEVPAPGGWSALISSTTPDGQASGSVTVDDEFAAPSAPSTIPEPNDPDGSDPTTPADAPTTAPSPEDSAPTDEPAADTDESAAGAGGGAASDGSGSTAPLLVGAAVLAAIIAGGGMVLARRQKDRAGSVE